VWCTLKQMPAGHAHVTAAAQPATTLSGSLWPGRYFTFSCVVLMISVSLRSPIISSKTHIWRVITNSHASSRSVTADDVHSHKHAPSRWDQTHPSVQ
jgi:hypothetical protein